MRTKIIFLLMFLLVNCAVYAQNKEEADKLVENGMTFHDKGDYEKALLIYDNALELDQDNFMALAEKAYTYLSMEKYDEAIKYCKTAIEKHPGEEELKTVYVTYGNALDNSNKTISALEIYDEGIKIFPDFYLLYFNKGITLTGLERYEESLQYFQKSVLLNPRHPGSHNALARISRIKNMRIPALLAYCRFFVLEPEGSRARENLASVQEIMNGSATQTGKNAVTINIDPAMLKDTTEDGARIENCFSTTDLLLSLTSALDYDKKNKKNSEVEQFIRKLETVCSTLKETQKDNFGFYWEYYVPYFVEMNDKNYLETFAYLVFASSDDSGVSKWLKTHETELKEFYAWSKEFEWKR